MDRPIAIDLFAGVGGLSLGLEQAGFDVLVAVEFDPIHAACHKFNFPRCEVLPRSIKSLTAKRIREVSGLGNRRVDLVAGGPPCQGFSTMGHRALEDPRNALVGEFVRILVELDARYFVFENVKGLTIGRHKLFLDELVRLLSANGYHVRLPWRVLNAVHYGVPQNRERLILLGAKEGLAVPNYPAATTSKAGNEGDLLSLPRGPSCREALDDIPDAELFVELASADEVDTTLWGTPSAYAEELRCLSRQSWYLGYRRTWQPRLLTSSMRTDHSQVSRRRFMRTSEGEVEPISHFYKLSATGVCNTLRAGTDSARGGFTSPRPIHYRFARCVTVREMARLQGFPDWFRFHRTKLHGARQVGNAVAPPMARAIGMEVARAMVLPPGCPTEVVELGEVKLLRMNMTDACTYWGVRSPIGRRDRRSGVKKRRQMEIDDGL